MPSQNMQMIFFCFSFCNYVLHISDCKQLEFILGEKRIHRRLHNLAPKSQSKVTAAIKLHNLVGKNWLNTIVW